MLIMKLLKLGALLLRFDKRLLFVCCCSLVLCKFTRQLSDLVLQGGMVVGYLCVLVLQSGEQLFFLLHLLHARFEFSDLRLVRLDLAGVLLGGGGGCELSEKFDFPFFSELEIRLRPLQPVHETLQLRTLAFVFVYLLLVLSLQILIRFCLQ